MMIRDSGQSAFRSMKSRRKPGNRKEERDDPVCERMF
jgi:hypothetical protein